MKGLLVKDLRIILCQKISIVIFLALGFYFLLTGEDVSFGIVYTMMLSAIFAISTISYDNQDNGMAFLLTLPTQRKNYVLSKYLFSVILVVIMGAIISAIAVGCSAFGVGTNDLTSIGEAFLVAMPMAVVMISIMIPIHIIFGSEKARVAGLLIIGIIFALAFLIVKVAGDMLEKLAGLLEKLQAMSSVQLILIGVCIMAVLLIISMMITIKALEKKEY